jgi:hypothetical protein
MSQKINVDIITEYKGRQNLKSAEKDLGSFQQSLNKLGKQFAEVFAVDKLIQFGKASAAAFAADQKSAAILTQTLSNLGLAFSNVPVENFITKLSEVNGIAKTDLRTSFDTLVRSTDDATKAQDLLSLGLDISAGTGKDLTLVTTALAKGYAGNFSALSKLGAGITAAELKTKNFDLIQKHLAATFKGDAAVAADTFQGKINRLKTSFEEFKITIGSGIADAFSSLTANGDVQGLQNAMDAIAIDIADIVRGTGVFAGQIGGILSSINGFSGGILGKILGFSFKHSILGELQTLGANSKKTLTDAANAAKMKIAQGPFAEGFTSVADHQKYVAAQAKLASDKAKQAAADLAAQKKITDQKQKQLQLDRDALSLKLAGNTTDMQNIEIQAALQRGQTEQVTNVLLLQRAIITGNADQANILAEEVLKANGLVMDVNGNISTLANAKDPFKDWPPATAAAMTQLKAIQDALALITDKKITVTVNTVYTTSGTPSGSGIPGGSSGGSVTTTIPKLGNANEGAPIVIPSSGINQGNPNALGNANEGAPISYVPVISTVNPSITQTNNPYNPNGANEGAPITVNVQIDGTAITNTLVNNSASGIPVSMNRSGYFSGLTAI